MAGLPKRNLILAAVVLGIGVFLFIWICPYLDMKGHGRLCIGLYAILLLIYVYGRATVARTPRKRE